MFLRNGLDKNDSKYNAVQILQTTVAPLWKGVPLLQFFYEIPGLKSQTPLFKVHHVAI